MELPSPDVDVESASAGNRESEITLIRLGSADAGGIYTHGRDSLMRKKLRRRKGTHEEFMDAC